MNAHHHRQLQQARQRIARNRRVLQGDAQRLSQIVQARLNWKLQSQKHPLAMLLGAVGLGVVASRLLSSFSSGQGWEQSLFRWAKRRLGGNFWRQLLATVWPEGEAENEADRTDASTSAEDAS